MYTVIKIVPYIYANTMNQHQFMALLKEVEDPEFNDLVLFTNAYWLSCKRILPRFTMLLTPIQDFLETEEYLPHFQ